MTLGQKAIKIEYTKSWKKIFFFSFFVGLTLIEPMWDSSNIFEGYDLKTHRDDT
ncbi:hypothetical protein FD20_GL000407 [Liquorilactobacillus uvarum DSM 19971]|uniref:Uncharacterized protein n=1 Tax=Liquorilactobacillus uvarum DSM 19971 TaxID=1423812 RepID=A0A0R1PXX8_9LACO|nr:hypothetical protein FD20_GL000407 [Liquorilactobacillus uvarum DSM 19971]